MTLVNISILEWVIIGLALVALGTYIAYSIYRSKHPKQKKEDEDE